MLASVIERYPEVAKWAMRDAGRCASPNRGRARPRRSAPETASRASRAAGRAIPRDASSRRTAWAESRRRPRPPGRNAARATAQEGIRAYRSRRRRQSPRFDRAGGWDFRCADATGWRCTGAVQEDWVRESLLGLLV